MEKGRRRNHQRGAGTWILESEESIPGKTLGYREIPDLWNTRSESPRVDETSWRMVQAV